MGDLEEVLDAWRSLDPARDQAVLATVVHVTGSAYRRPGARMLVLPDGRRVGMVSGGCLEGDIMRKAWWFTESPRPVVRVYDTSSDDDAVWEFGLGCNGVVHVMLERVASPDTRDVLAFLDARCRAREPAVIATVVAADDAAEAQVGDRLLVDARGICGGTLRHRSEAAEVYVHARRALAGQSSHLARLPGCAVFIERLAPPLDLVVFGAGDDVMPLVSMGATLGWRVTVADPRPAHARADRFPAAARVLVLSRDQPLRALDITADTFVVLMTHNYPLDVRLLPSILERHPRYVGLLGPRHRAERLFEGLGRSMPSSVHAPAGLDVGGDNPAGIALSIVSEVQAVLSRRDGGMLRLRSATIHAPVLEVGSAPMTPSGDTERPTSCETMVGSHAA